MDKDSLVSVIVPTFNAEKYISETLESLLSQSYKNFELGVVLNGFSANS